MRPTGLNVSLAEEDKRKGMELRVPAPLIVKSIGEYSKQLEQIIQFKMMGSRVNANEFFANTPTTTARRYINELLSLRWIGFDGEYIYPRSWSRIGYKKKKGLYIVTIPKNLSEFLFTYSLQVVTKREARTRVRQRGRAKPKGEGLPVRYYSEALNIPERTFYRKLKAAKKTGLLISKPQKTVIGKATDYHSFRKNLHGIPVFKNGDYTVVPAPCIYKFNLV